MPCGSDDLLGSLNGDSQKKSLFGTINGYYRRVKGRSDKVGERRELPTLPDSRGNLTFVNGEDHIPFEIKRVYFLHGVPENGERGAHAHRRLTQAIIALSGSFEVSLDDGYRKESFALNNPSECLIVQNMTWRVLSKFSKGAICLVLASEKFDEDDYLRNYDHFLRELS